MAYGYSYSMTSASLFTKVVNFPSGFSSPFAVSVDGIVLGTDYAAGDSVVFADFAGTLGGLLVNGEGVQSFEITRPSLHDIFVRIAGEDGKEAAHA